MPAISSPATEASSSSSSVASGSRISSLLPALVRRLYFSPPNPKSYSRLSTGGLVAVVVVTVVAFIAIVIFSVWIARRRVSNRMFGLTPARQSKRTQWHEHAGLYRGPRDRLGEQPQPASPRAARPHGRAQQPHGGAPLACCCCRAECHPHCSVRYMYS